MRVRPSFILVVVGIRPQCEEKVYYARISAAEVAILRVVFDDSVPPTPQECQCDTKRIHGGESQAEEPNGTEDSKNLLDIR